MLHCGFALDGIGYHVVGFIPDQHFHIIFFAEYGALALLMRMDACGKVIGHADVECAIAFACHDVNKALRHDSAWQVWVAGSSPAMESGGGLAPKFSYFNFSSC